MNYHPHENFLDPHSQTLSYWLFPVPWPLGISLRCDMKTRQPAQLRFRSSKAFITFVVCVALFTVGSEEQDTSNEQSRLTPLYLVIG